MQNKQSSIGNYDDVFNPIVFDQIGSNSICLDVGCWTGNLGDKLINQKACTVDGIDYRSDVLIEAKKAGYRNLYQINLNNDDYKIDINTKYDFIICADVLEHLINPQGVLQKLDDLLTTDGKIVISIPNIAFIQQRIVHLLGKFDYNPNGGIMDATHLRFFTKKSLLKMCHDAGYQIQKIEGYSLVKNRYFFLRLLAKLLPTLFAIQFIVILKRGSQRGA